MFTRRVLLQAGAMAALSGLLPRPSFGATDETFLLCARDDKGYAAYEVSATGQLIGPRLALPTRGHGLATVKAQDKPRHTAIIARRPGHYVLINGQNVIAPPSTHQLNGHGVFSPDGNTLYTTETALETGNGWLGVYAQTGRNRWDRIKALSTHGIDPHDILLSPDGHHLIVANGGRLTHPDFPRHHLNPGEIEPSIVTLNRHTGELVHKGQSPGLSGRVSVRHLTLQNGTVWWAGQLEDSAPLGTPLMGTYTLENGVRVLDSVTSAHLGRYLGSIHTLGATDPIIVTNPRANQATAVSTQTLQIVDQWQIPDVCAVAGQTNLVFGDGTGGIGGIGRLGARHTHAHIQWDNHMISLGYT